MKKRMKALIFPEPWVVKIIEVDTPKPGPNEILAEIESVGICGSDVGIFEGTHWITTNKPGGHGHETGAIAVEIGKNIEHISEGDHLARMGCGYAEYSTHVNVIGHGKDELTKPLPIVRNDLSTEEISFADAVGCAINCYERAEFDRIDGEKKAIVLGLGPIGLILTQILLINGVKVAASEPFQQKRSVAQKWGAQVFNPNEYTRPTHGNETVMDDIKRQFGESHAVFEMVGHNDTLLAAINFIKPGYRVIIFGAQKMQNIPYVNCRKKGVELVYPEAMINSKEDKDYWNNALDLISNKKLDLKSLISKRITLEDAINAFKYYDREKWIKIIVKPQKK